MITRQMNLARSVLDVLSGAGLRCAVAGGAPRDWLLGRAATDLDIYIESPEPIGTNDIFSRGAVLPIPYFSDLGFTHLENLSTRNLDDIEDVLAYGRLAGIKGVYNCFYSTNMKIQLIQIEGSIDSFVSRFPAICQASMKPGKIMSGTIKFMFAHSARRFVVTEDTPYVEKLRNKFPDYECIVEPPITTSSDELINNIWARDGSWVIETPINVRDVVARQSERSIVDMLYEGRTTTTTASNNTLSVTEPW